MYKLKTKAITQDRNGKTYEHDVLIKASTYDKIKSVVVKIEDTPGQWYLETLLEPGNEVRETISIDMGQSWDCINMGKIMTEVKGLIGTKINAKDYSPIY